MSRAHALHHLLLLEFFRLEGEILLLLQIVELPSVAVRKIIPLTDPHLKTAFLRVVVGAHKGFDAEIVPDDIALYRAAGTTDVNELPFAISPLHRESHLVPAEDREIGLCRKACKLLTII